MDMDTRHPSELGARMWKLLLLPQPKAAAVESMVSSPTTGVLAVALGYPGYSASCSMDSGGRRASRAWTSLKWPDVTVRWAPETGVSLALLVALTPPGVLRHKSRLSVCGLQLGQAVHSEAFRPTSVSQLWGVPPSHRRESWNSEQLTQSPSGWKSHSGKL